MPTVPPVGRFRRTDRIRKRVTFLRIQSEGRRVSTPHFTFLVFASSARSENQDPPRLGIVASKKIGNAPARSRAKRLTREAFRATRERMGSGIDLVVIVRKPLTVMKLADVIREWQGAERDLDRRIAEARRKP